MYKLDVAGLKIDAVTKKEVLETIGERVGKNHKTFLTTPYSEFLFAALTDRKTLETLNRADIAVADGIGIFWAAKFLQIPVTAKTYWGKIFQICWQAKYSLASILLYPKYIKSVLPEKISGSDLVWDIAKLAADNGWSIYLLGGFGDTPQLAAEKLKIQNSKLKIAGTSNKNPGDFGVLEEIKRAGPDILLVAYGPLKQEVWIEENLPNLPVKLAVGLGGTFDYLAGKKPEAPQFLRKIGLEWLYRLFTQPHRARRIWNATFGLVSKTMLYKIYQQMPYRKNVAAVILNKENKVLICKRNSNPKKEDVASHYPGKYANYWQFPQGGLDENENIEEGAMREAFEETSLKNLRPLYTSGQTNEYLFPLYWPRIFMKNFRYKGQNQNIVYLLHGGQDGEVKVDNYEFTDYKWVLTSDIEKTVNKERKNLTAIVIKDLKEMQEKAII